MSKRFISYSLILNGVTEDNSIGSIALLQKDIDREAGMGHPKYGFAESGFASDGSFLVNGKLYANTVKECKSNLADFKRLAKETFDKCKKIGINYVVEGKTI